MVYAPDEKAMFIFLIGIVLWISTAAADQAPLANRGSWALGVALPSSSGLSLSLWKVRSPSTALGLEMAFSSNYYKYTTDDRDNRDRHYTHQSRRLRLQLRPTIKRYRPLHDRVASFVFYQVRVGFSTSRSRQEQIDRPMLQSTSSTGILGLALGLGAHWFPFQRLSLSGQTGLVLSYQHADSRFHRRWEGSLKTFQTAVAALVYF